MNVTARHLVMAIFLAAATQLYAPAATSGQAPLLTLSDAAIAAIEADPTLAAALARENAAEADVRRATAARLPTLNLEGAVTRFQEPMVVAPLHSFDPSSPPRFDEALVQGAARLRYTAFDGGRVGSSVRAARSAREATEGHTATRRMDVLARVTEAYLGVLGARAHQDAAERQVTALEAEHVRARQRVETGSAAEVELLRASAALEEARAAAISARARMELTERSLARTMGVDPSEIIEAGLEEIDVGDPVANETGPLVTSSAPVAHPDLEAAAAYERAASERLDGERAARLPRLDVTAAMLDYGTWSGGHVAEWQVGVAVSWPLFTGGARSALIRRTEAELSAARRETEAVARSIDAAIDAARSAIVEADARSEALDASVRQWTEVAPIEAHALDTGAGTQSDLLTAEASLFRARAGLAEARYARLLARVQLARALGRLDLDWLQRTLEVE
ncbi:MAG: TolC family protein [Gemmatimonadota bacterium]